MSKIIQLSEQLANLIAAGEVVERPGSVVKELIENSIDAGAKHITVEIKNGGITYIRVTDDGAGIEQSDVKIAFLRHATSKLRSEADLAAIATLGFRGEALAATASVSKVDMFTKRKCDLEGTHISIEGGNETGFTPTGCPDGTSIIIRDLFFNIPARMKFLKKDATEGGYAESAVMNAALSRPDIGFKLIKDNRDSFTSHGDGRLSSVIYSVCGKDTATKMISVSGAFGSISIDGYISSPTIGRATKSMQSFFINGRPVRSRVLLAALDEAYKGRLMVGRHAICFLNLRIDHSAVDVNVHPAKLDVKFSREKEVFSAIYNSVFAALDAHDIFNENDMQKAAPAVPPEDNMTDNQQVFEYKPQNNLITFPESYATAHNKLANEMKVQYKSSYADSKLEIMDDVKQIYLTPAIQKNPVECATYQSTIYKNEDKDNGFLPCIKEAEIAVQSEQSCDIIAISEIFSTYIIASEGDALWLIDKHAAHEKIIYNELAKMAERQDSQMLIMPETISLPNTDKAICLQNVSELAKIGFEIEDFGGNALLVRQIPMYLQPRDIEYALSEIAEKLALNRKNCVSIYDELLKSVACRAAIKAGNKNELFELQRLAEQVMSFSDVRNCPHGRPVAVKMTRYEIEKLFKRVK